MVPDNAPELATAEQAEVHRQLVKILESSAFCNAPRAQRFLQFVVEEALAGRSSAINEVLVAARAFNLGSFDRQKNSIVRAEAVHVRRRLRDYYMGAGASDSVVVELPRGAYVPLIRTGVVKPWHARWRQLCAQSESKEKGRLGAARGGIPWISDQHIDCVRLLKNLRNACAHAFVLVDVQLNWHDIRSVRYHFGLSRSRENPISLIGEVKCGLHPDPSARSGNKCGWHLANIARRSLISRKPTILGDSPNVSGPHGSETPGA
jgi:hypothetical protein